jgi:RNA polymerase sigma-70 factor (ECF subfamily)
VNRPHETDLLRRAATGDRAAYDAFVQELAPAVWSIVRRLTADEATAEDAMQETFVAGWRSAPAFRAEGSARSWIYGLARRHAARTWRRRAGEPSETTPLCDLALAAGWGTDPEVLASRSEDRSTLLAALSTLPEADQQVLTRCDLEGATPSDLAAQLGIPAGTVRVRRHRARLKLLAALAPEDSNE